MKFAKYLTAAAVVSALAATPALAGGMKRSDMKQRNTNAQLTYSNSETRTDRGWMESRADRNWDSRADVGWDSRTDRRFSDSRADRGFWPGDVAAGVVGGAVGTAGAIAGGAVNTAGAIATAPFGGPYRDSFAYDDRWDQRDGFVAFRPYDPNGPVCQAGTWFTGQDGRQHICQ